MRQRSPDAAETLEYVRDLLQELRVIARPDGGAFLGYLIEMAQAEAAEQVRTLRREERVPEASSGDQRNSSP